MLTRTLKYFFGSFFISVRSFRKSPTAPFMFSYNRSSFSSLPAVSSPAFNRAAKVAQVRRGPFSESAKELSLTNLPRLPSPELNSRLDSA